MFDTGISRSSYSVMTVLMNTIDEGIYSFTPLWVWEEIVAIDLNREIFVLAFSNYE